MAEKRYFWLKLQEGFFQQKAMKKLRSVEKGETYLIVYLKLQLASVKEGGVLTFDGIENTLAEELALQIDEESEDVSITVDFLTRHKLLVALSETETLLTEAVENIGSEGSSAKRMRDFRARQAEKASLCYGEKSREEKSREETEKRESREEAPPPFFGSDFKPPSLDEVKAYCEETGLVKMDPEKFLDYYAGRGWSTSSGPVSDWKALARNWERREKTDGKEKAFTDYDGEEDFLNG